MPLLKYSSVLFILFFGLISHAQINKHEPLTTKEGLTDNLAHYTQLIFKDTFGYIWITTYSGLNRYDGYEITRYNKQSPAPQDLPIKRLTVITGDQNGNIWLGTDFDDVIHFDQKKETFTALSDIVKNSETFNLGKINGFKTNDDQNLIITTYDNRSFTFYNDSKILKKNELLKMEKLVSHPIRYEMPLTNGEIIYVGHEIFKLKNDTISHIWKYDKSYILYIMELPNNKIYIEPNGADLRAIYDNETHELNLYERHEDLSSYFLDDSEPYYIWGQPINLPPKFTNGQFNFNKTFNCEKLPSYIFDFDSDLSGDIIYASDFGGAGKIKFSDKTFSTTNIYLKEVRKINDEILVGSYGSILKFSDDTLRPILTFNKEKGSIPWNFAINADSNIVINLNISPFSTFVFDKQGQLIKGPFNSTLHDQMLLFQDGNLVVDSRQPKNKSNNTLKFVGDYYESLSDEDFPGARARYFYQSSNEDIWISTLNGQFIRIFDGYQQFEKIRTDGNGNGKLRNAKISYIYEAYNKLYLCNESGIDIYNLATNEIEYLDLQIGDLPFYIKGMTHDDEGNVWMMDNNILFRYNNKDQSLSKYYVPEEFKIKVNPCKDLVYKDNTIFYPSKSGITSIDLSKLKAARKPQDVIFQDLFIDRQKIYPLDSYEILDSSLLYQPSFQLNFNRRNVGFKFVSVDSKELHAEYFYRLVGLNDNWINIGEDRIVHFTNLDPGQYQFETKVRSSDGQWCSNIATRFFRVFSPWYATWWAYLIYLSIVSFIIYTIYTMKVNKIREQEQLRVKISRDLHDDVGGLLTGLNMQSEMLELSIDGKPKLIAGKIKSLGKEALSRMRDTVWAIDASKDDVMSLVDRMKDHAEITLGAADFNIKYKIDIEDKKLILPPNIRQQTFLIFKEAITNAAKHSNGNQIDILFSLKNKVIYLTIKDNGEVGPLKTSGLGMTSMNDRAKSVNGTFKIDTSNGFKIEFKVNW